MPLIALNFNTQTSVCSIEAQASGSLVAHVHAHARLSGLFVFSRLRLASPRLASPHLVLSPRQQQGVSGSRSGGRQRQQQRRQSTPRVTRTRMSWHCGDALCNAANAMHADAIAPRWFGSRARGAAREQCVAPFTRPVTTMHRRRTQLRPV